MIGQDAFCIRRATPQDGTEIARIHVDAWRDAYAALIPAEYLSRMDARIVFTKLYVALLLLILVVTAGGVGWFMIQGGSFL